MFLSEKASTTFYAFIFMHYIQNASGARYTVRSPTNFFGKSSCELRPFSQSFRYDKLFHAVVSTSVFRYYLSVR